MTAGEPQPQAWPCETGSRSSTSPAPRTSAPHQSTRPGAVGGRSRQHAAGEGQREQGDAEPDPERPPVVGAVAGEQAGGHQADDAADGQRAADDGHRHAEPGLGQLPAQHADRQREQPVGGALQDPAHEQQRQGRRDDGEQGAGGDGDEDPEDHRPLAPQVAQPAEHRGEDRGGEQVGRQHPAGGAGGDVAAAPRWRREPGRRGSAAATASSRRAPARGPAAPGRGGARAAVRCGARRDQTTPQACSSRGAGRPMGVNLVTRCQVNVTNRRLRPQSAGDDSPSTTCRRP